MAQENARESLRSSVDVSDFIQDSEVEAEDGLLAHKVLNNENNKSSTKQKVGFGILFVFSLFLLLLTWVSIGRDVFFGRAACSVGSVIGKEEHQDPGHQHHGGHHTPSTTRGSAVCVCGVLCA